MCQPLGWYHRRGSEQGGHDDTTSIGHALGGVILRHNTAASARVTPSSVSRNVSSGALKSALVKLNAGDYPVPPAEVAALDEQGRANATPEHANYAMGTTSNGRAETIEQCLGVELIPQLILLITRQLTCPCTSLTQR